MELPRTNELEYVELLGQTKALSQELLLAIKPIVNKHKNALILINALIWMHTIMLNEMLDETADNKREAVDFTGKKMMDLLNQLIEKESNANKSQ